MKDSNFTTVYSENTVYTIAKDGKWSAIKVGDHMYSGGKLTQAKYNRLVEICHELGFHGVGEFVLE